MAPTQTLDFDSVAAEPVEAVEREALDLPAQFGRYHLIEFLAKGGMAEIYLARSFGAEGFVKPLVIKRLAPHLVSQDFFANLFISEAKLLAALSHSNIVPVFDFGRVGDDLFIAMDLVRGISLRGLLEGLAQRGTQLPPSITAHIGMEVCKGLHYAHRKRGDSGEQLGIVHRDVKPNNVLISLEGEVKLVDFGVAKLADSVDDRLAGTVAYMSPEQAAGEEVDYRTDIFSLGLMLREMVTGERVYDGETGGRLLAQAKAGDVPAPKGVDHELSRVIVRATQRDPSLRFDSAQAMERALASYFYRAWAEMQRSDGPVDMLRDILTSLDLQQLSTEAASDGTRMTVYDRLAYTQATLPAPSEVSGMTPLAYIASGGFDAQPPDLSLLTSAARRLDSRRVAQQAAVDSLVVTRKNAVMEPGSTALVVGSPRRWLPLAIAAVLLALGGLGWVLLRSPDEAPAKPSVAAQPAATIAVDAGAAVAVAPDASVPDTQVPDLGADTAAPAKVAVRRPSKRRKLRKGRKPRKGSRRAKPGGRKLPPDTELPIEF